MFHIERHCSVSFLSHLDFLIMNKARKYSPIVGLALLCATEIETRKLRIDVNTKHGHVIGLTLLFHDQDGELKEGVQTNYRHLIWLAHVLKMMMRSEP